jgi:hypothetical protein
MGLDRVHDAGPGWLVLLRGCEVARLCARGDVRLCRIEDVSRVCVLSREVWWRRVCG